MTGCVKSSNGIRKYKPDRGKVFDAKTLKGDAEKFSRYLDRDGDGVAYRSYPGVDGDGAYFVRGSGHNQYGGYTEDAAEYQQVIDRLMLKWGTAKKLVPDPYIRRTRKASSIRDCFRGQL